MSRHSFGRAVGVALFIFASATADSGQGQLKVTTPKPGDCIQLYRWTDQKLGISDGLSQIVRITRDGFDGSGTGFLLPGCRVMTAAHVVAGSRSDCFTTGELDPSNSRRVARLSRALASRHDARG
jgi:hypothetical protein